MTCVSECSTNCSRHGCSTRTTSGGAGGSSVMAPHVHRNSSCLHGTSWATWLGSGLGVGLGLGLGLRVGVGVGVGVGLGVGLGLGLGLGVGVGVGPGLGLGLGWAQLRPDFERDEGAQLRMEALDIGTAAAQRGRGTVAARGRRRVVP